VPLIRLGVLRQPRPSRLPRNTYSSGEVGGTLGERLSFWCPRLVGGGNGAGAGPGLPDLAALDLKRVVTIPDRSFPVAECHAEKIRENVMPPESGRLWPRKLQALFTPGIYRRSRVDAGALAASSAAIMRARVSMPRIRSSGFRSGSMAWSCSISCRRVRSASIAASFPVWGSAGGRLSQAAVSVFAGES